MTCPTPAFTYNDAAFRAAFPFFANTTTYPEALLSMYYDTAGHFISNSNYGFLSAACATQFALYLMTAHLARLGSMIAAGQTPGVTIAATIDKISVQLQQAVLKNQWQYWLASTPFGAELLALLQVKGVGGFYHPGSPGRAGFFAAQPYSLRGRC